MGFDPKDFDFDTFPKVEIPVKYDGKEYTLRPADGVTGTAYKKAQAKGARMVEGKFQADLSELAESEPLLVGGCLYTADGKQVGTTFAKSLPTPILQKLYAAAKEISGLDNKPQTEADLIQDVIRAQRALADFRKAKAAGEGTDPKASPSDSTGGSE